jgi:hypothetical protein
MPYASGAISLVLVGSVTTLWSYELSRQQNNYPYDTTRPTYVHTHSGGFFLGGGYGHDSDISRGGFGSTGHSHGGFFGGHS